MPASPTDREKLKRLYRELQDKQLWPDDPEYVRIFELPELYPTDPVERMAVAIEFAALETVQLFSGHRGTGKSTELRRLKRRLERDPSYKVVICDMEDYLPMTAPVDVVDFMLALAGALSEALNVPEPLGHNPTITYWARFTGWLQSQRIEVSELGIGAKAAAGAPDLGLGAEATASVKLNLKSDPEFRTRVRERMKLHVGAFVAEVHAYAQDCLTQLRARHGEGTQLVVLYDSIEHLRGTTMSANEVVASVERLFRGHADALRFPYVHLVFTVPPWLQFYTAGVGDGYSGYCQIPCVKVADRDGAPFRAGLDVLHRVAAARGDVDALLGSREAFDHLARLSGGYLRDLFRLLSFLVLEAPRAGLPVSAGLRELAIEDLRNTYKGFSNRDAEWLERIHASGEAATDQRDELHDLARFLDTHLILAYRNGGDWYAVHPIILGVVRDRAAAWRERQEAKEGA